MTIRKLTARLLPLAAVAAFGCATPAPTPAPRPEVATGETDAPPPEFGFVPSEKDRASIGTGFTGHSEAPEASGFERGLNLAAVKPEGPLGKAGVKDGDLLLAVGAVRVRGDVEDSIGTFRDELAALQPETRATVTYARAGEVHEADILLGRRPPVFDDRDTPQDWFTKLEADPADQLLFDRVLDLEGAREIWEDVLAHNTKRFARTDWFRLRQTVQAQLNLPAQEALAAEIVAGLAAHPVSGAALVSDQGETPRHHPEREPIPAGAGLETLVDRIEQFVLALDESLRVDLADWTDAERKAFAEDFPRLVERLDMGEYMYNDPDTLRQRAARRVVALLQRVSPQLLAIEAYAAVTFQREIVPELERAARADGRTGLLLGRDTPAGRIEIWGGGNQRHTKRCAFRFDLEGNDDYLDNAARADLDQPVSINIDMAGDDQYGATSPGCQAGAMGGIAILVDAAGDDQYLAAGWSQAAAVAGYALLLDESGNDTYRGLDECQGVAFVGSAVLHDVQGDDTYVGDRFCQGVGFGAGVGALVDDDGDDRYACTGRYGSEYGEPGLFSGWGQGVGFGFRLLTSGGIGVLNDRGGDDVYEAGNFSQGGGYFFAWGILQDDAGDDLYRGSRYAMGYAAHQAQGTFIERAGNDRYQSVSSVANGLSWDETCVVFHDHAGDDVYETSGFSLGAAAHNGMVLFRDDAGDDRYKAPPGRASPNNYHGGHSFAVVVDSGGGTDVYGNTPPSRWNDRVSWKQDRCYVLDLPVAPGLLTDYVRPKKDAAE